MLKFIRAEFQVENVDDDGTNNDIENDDEHDDYNYDNDNGVGSCGDNYGDFNDDNGGADDVNCNDDYD